MTVVTMPFGPWRPDPPDHSNAGDLKNLRGVIRNGGALRGVPLLFEWGDDTDMGATRTSGAISVTQTGFNVPATTDEIVSGYVVAGDDADLWQLPVDALNSELGAVSKVSKAGGYGTGTFAIRPWSMCSYGDIVVATNLSDPIQKMVPSATPTLFSDLVTSTDKPQAEFVVTLGSHILIGNILTIAVTALGAAGLYHDYIWTSGTDLINEFGSAVSGSSFQPLKGIPGRITGMAGGERHAIVFKPRGCYLISLVDSAGTYRVDPMSPSIGTIWPKSIVSDGGVVYFWGTNGGIYRIVNNGSPERISQVVDDWLSSEVEDRAMNWYEGKIGGGVYMASPQTRVWGFVEAKTGNIGWLYQGIGLEADGTQYKWTFIFYSPTSGEFSVIDPNLTTIYDDASMHVSGVVETGHGMLDENAGFNLQSLVFKWGTSPRVAASRSRIYGFASSRPLISPPLGTPRSYMVPRNVVELGTHIFSPSAISEQDNRVQRVAINAISFIFDGQGGLTRPSISMTISYGTLPDLTDAAQVTINEDNRLSDSRWYSVPSEVNGVWFRIDNISLYTVEGSYSLYSLRSFYGISLDIEVIGGE